jgi:ribosomal protein L25 (general stress protein Ctc)
MKKFVLVALLVAAFTPSFSQNEKGLARVNRIDGVEVYFMNEPLNEYRVVFDIGTGLKASSLITGGLVNEGVSEKAAQYVKKAIKEAKEEKHDFDAIVYSSGKKVIAVKFEKPNPQYKALAKVQKIEGLEVYILSEPLKDYEVLNSRKGGVKMKSYLTGGLVNNSIEEDVAQFVRKLVKDSEKENEKIDGIVYGAGKNASGIKFK